MSCRQSPAPEFRSPRRMADLQPAFAAQKCATTRCFRPAVVEYGERLCAECALLALEFDTREADTFGPRVLPDALPGAVSRELALAQTGLETGAGQGDAGCWVATGDPAEPFRWDALPGRVETGIAVLDEPTWEKFKQQWIGLDAVSGMGQAEEERGQGKDVPKSKSESESEDPRETPIFLPCPGRCGTRVRYGGYCAACTVRNEALRAAFAGTPEPDETAPPLAQAPTQPRVETGLAAAPARPLGAMFWLTLLGVVVVLKLALTMGSRAVPVW